MCEKNTNFEKKIHIFEKRTDFFSGFFSVYSCHSSLSKSVDVVWLVEILCIVTWSAAGMAEQFLPGHATLPTAKVRYVRTATVPPVPHAVKLNMITKLTILFACIVFIACSAAGLGCVEAFRRVTVVGFHSRAHRHVQVAIAAVFHVGAMFGARCAALMPVPAVVTQVGVHQSAVLCRSTVAIWTITVHRGKLRLGYSEACFIHFTRGAAQLSVFTGVTSLRREGRTVASI